MKPCVLAGALALAGCAPPEEAPLETGGNGAAVLVGVQAALPTEDVRQAVQAEASRRYRKDCGTVTLPDDAFVPIEVTGGGHPEYAVFFSRARCDANGASSWFSGTGGTRIQIWSSSGDAPVLLLNHAMHGFTPTDDGLISFQHGSFCPGGSGPQTCVVTYRWRGPEDGFEVQSRRLYDGQDPSRMPAMRFDWDHPLRG